MVLHVPVYVYNTLMWNQQVHTDKYTPIYNNIILCVTNKYIYIFAQCMSYLWVQVSRRGKPTLKERSRSDWLLSVYGSESTSGEQEAVLGNAVSCTAGSRNPMVSHRHKGIVRAFLISHPAVQFTYHFYLLTHNSDENLISVCEYEISLLILFIKGLHFFYDLVTFGWQ